MTAKQSTQDRATVAAMASDQIDAAIQTMRAGKETMGKTRVVHVNDRIEGAIYVGRAMPRRRLKASPFANPYRIGAPAAHWIQHDPITREGALAAYAMDMMGGPMRHLLADLPALRNRPMACWCRRDGVPMTNGTTLPGPDNRCHADYLCHLIEQYTDDELIAMSREGGDDD